MIKFIPFELVHLLDIDLVDAGKLFALNPYEIVKYPCFTVLLDDKVIAVGGCHPFLWNTRYNCWAFFRPESSKYMLRILKFTKNIIHNLDYIPRLECHVLQDFEQGNKFAKLLGFTLETENGCKNFTNKLECVNQYSIINGE